MATFLDDGHYKLKTIRGLEDPHDMKFVRAWAEALFADIKDVFSEPFAALIGERHAGAAECTWQIGMYRTRPETGQPELDLSQPLLRADCEHRYIARCLNDFNESYIGAVEIGIVVSAQHTGLYHPRSIAKLLARLALMHYYELVGGFYLKWSTEYLDAPTFSRRQIEEVSSIDDLWLP